MVLHEITNYGRKRNRCCRVPRRHVGSWIYPAAHIWEVGDSGTVVEELGMTRLESVSHNFRGALKRCPWWGASTTKGSNSNLPTTANVGKSSDLGCTITASQRGSQAVLPKRFCCIIPRYLTRSWICLHSVQPIQDPALAKLPANKNTKATMHFPYNKETNSVIYMA
jgi:hypothetical protein